MNIALEEAERAFEKKEVPVGAVVTLNGELIAKAHNSPVSLKDPSAHAEILALRAAGKHTGNYRLGEASLYVTIEPCIMCCGAIIQARISRLVFGARDPKGGAVYSLYRVLNDSRLNHLVDVSEGILSAAAGEILSRFFRKKRLTLPARQ